MDGQMCESCPDAAKAEVMVTLLDGGGRSMVCANCLRKAVDKMTGERVTAPAAAAPDWTKPAPAPEKKKTRHEGWI